MAIRNNEAAHDADRKLDCSVAHHAEGGNSRRIRHPRCCSTKLKTKNARKKLLQTSHLHIAYSSYRTVGTTKGKPFGMSTTKYDLPHSPENKQPFVGRGRRHPNLQLHYCIAVGLNCRGRERRRARPQTAGGSVPLCADYSSPRGCPDDGNPLSHDPCNAIQFIRSAGVTSKQGHTILDPQRASIGVLFRTSSQNKLNTVVSASAILSSSKKNTGLFDTYRRRHERRREQHHARK